ncbi:hypothetical protein [uncultured Roseovarius sp.]|uniref:hypothetical protein n=1 Tax=uncultured Roseovarius sp. TaxID=293344 RepID=UPI00262A6DBE|nr:hypothetical protein [uncultured Roseovarius sp.]
METLRDLTEQIHGIRINSETVLRDQVLRSDSVRGLVEGEIRGVRTLRVTSKGGVSFEVVMALDPDTVAYIRRAARQGAEMRWRAILFMLALGPVPAAIGEALVTAAVAGGASRRGHTVMDKGRTTADLSILRPTGRVLSHRVLSAELLEGQWRVRVAAQVGSVSAGACAARRRLTISATLPVVRVSTKVFAWAEPMAQSVAHDFIDTLHRHPDAGLDSIASAASGPVAAALDYAALTRGRAEPAVGDHRLRPSIVIEAAGKGVRLTLTLALRGPDGQRRRHGLTCASLAFVDDPNDRFDLLDMAEPGNRHVTLRPLDPTRHAQSFEGLLVYFLEAGL